MKKLLILISVLLLAGCAITQKTGLVDYKPEVAPNKLQKEFDTIPPPIGRRVTVAVYSFQDKTGQRKPTPGIASLSTAVTQGGEVFLIKALQDVGRGNWFDVVERTAIDNLVKERTIIKQMREAYEGKDAKALMPLQFAGIIMEGGIIGYDTGTESGGAAYRFLGIGPSTQYSKDTVTISLRAISVNTGKVLAAVTVTKIVYSTADAVAVLKYIDNKNIAAGVFGGADNVNTLTASMFEAETGLTINEPGTLAVKATVEAAVVELIKEGERKGVWDFKKPEAPVSVASPPPVVAAADPKEIAKNPTNPVAVVRGPPPEVKKEEPKAPEVKAGVMYLKETSFVFKEANERSQRTWQLLKGTEFSITPAVDGWVAVVAKDGKKGYVRQDVLSAEPIVVPEVVKGNEPLVKKEVNVKALRAKDEAK